MPVMQPASKWLVVDACCSLGGSSPPHAPRTNAAAARPIAVALFMMVPPMPLQRSVERRANPEQRKSLLGHSCHAGRTDESVCYRVRHALLQRVYRRAAIIKGLKPLIFVLLR